MTTFCRKHCAPGWRTDRTVGRFFVKFFLLLSFFASFSAKLATFYHRSSTRDHREVMLQWCIATLRREVVTMYLFFIRQPCILSDRRTFARKAGECLRLLKEKVRAGQKMRQVLCGDHMCYPLLILSIRTHARQQSNHCGWRTACGKHLTVHKNIEHNQRHT